MAWYPDSFEPYRYPTARNYVEGAHTTFQVLSLSTLGATCYADALGIATAVGTELAEVVSKKLGGATVVVGRPALEKTQGDFSIKKMLLPIDPARVVGVPGDCLPEAEWYACDGSSWSSDSDARVTEMPVVRLYHWELDVCTSYEIRSPLTPFQQMGRQRHQRSWERCAYALLPNDLETGDNTSIVEPDVFLGWGTNEVPTLGSDTLRLAVWFHREFVRDGDCIEPNFVDDPDGSTKARVDAESRRLDEILAVVRQTPGCWCVSPKTAELLTSLSGTPPSGFEEFSYWDTAELISNFDALPSPIDPRARSFTVTIAWRLPGDGGEFLARVREFVAAEPQAVDTAVAKVADFAVAEFTARDLDLTKSTAKVLTQLEDVLRCLVEKIFDASGQRPATRCYWKQRYRVRLGTPYGAPEPDA